MECLNSIISQIRSKDVCTWFIEFETYRWREHCGYQFDNNIGYRSEEEFQSWKLKDPIELFKKEVDGKVDFKLIDELIMQEIIISLF